MAQWSTPDTVRAKLRRRWDTGSFLTARARGECFDAVDLPIRGPTATELGSQYAAVAAWARDWTSRAGAYTVRTTTIGARRTGANELPHRIRIDGFDELAEFLGTSDQARRYLELLDAAKAVAPELHSWVVDRPMRALSHEGQFTRLLACVRWVVDNADRNRYLRQVDAAGVDTKFIERHRGILRELLDLVIAAPVDAQSSDLEVRYGFRGKPSRIRIRVLDGSMTVLPSGLTDAEVRIDEFAACPAEVDRVFVVENEVTCLAFPSVARSILIYGEGYAVSRVSQLSWLNDCELHYWGDIDTHGFRILDLLRRRFPRAQSMLMDRGTLLAHEGHWDRETGPVNANLPGLTGEEAALYRDLVEDTFGTAVRLEQERIRYPLLEAAIRRIATLPTGGAM
jgi:hypothetical protein